MAQRRVEFYSSFHIVRKTPAIKNINANVTTNAEKYMVLSRFVYIIAFRSPSLT